MAGFEVEARLSLDALRRDIAAAKADLSRAFQGARIQAPKIELAKIDGNAAIADLQVQLAQIESFKGPDFAVSAQRLQAMRGEAARLEDIQQAISRGEFVGDDEIRRARALSREIKEAEFAKIDFEQQREGLQGIAVASGAAAAAMALLTKEAAQQAIAFDASVAKLSTLSDDSEQLAGNIRGLVQGLDGQTNSIEASAAAYEILSAGYTDTADTLAILEASTIGSVGGFSDVKTVADATTSVLSAYGDSAQNAGALVDQFVQVQALGKITVDQLAQSVGKATAITGPLGVGFDQVGAAIATATAQGIAAESAISGTRQAFVNLLKPTKDAQEILEQFGVSNVEATLKSEGLVGILQRLADQGATSQQLSQIFSDVDGLAVVSTLAGENLDKFKGNIDAVANSAGAASIAADKVADSFQGKLTQATNLASEALLNMGEGVAIALEPLLDVALAVVEGFLALPAPVQQAAGVVFLFTGAIAGLVFAITTLNTLNVINSGITAKNTIIKFANAAASAAQSAAQGALALATGKGTIAIAAQTKALQGLAIAAGTAAAALAVIGAAAGLGELLNQTNQLREANRELSALNGEVNAFFQGSIGIQRDLKEAAEARLNAQREGVELTAEQVAAEERALDRARQTLTVLEEQLETAKAQQAEAEKGRNGGLFGIGREAGEARANAADELVSSLEKDIGRVQSRRQTLAELAGEPIEGTTPVSIDAEVDTQAAEDAIDEAIANIERGASSRSIELDLERSRVELGALESGSSEEQNFAIAQDFAARRIELAKQTVADLRELEAQNPGNEEISTKRLQAELDLTNAQKARVESQIAEEKRLQQAREDAEAEALKAAGDAARARADAEKAALEEVQRSQKLALEAVKDAEVERSALIGERELQLRQQGTAQVEIEREIAELSLQARRDSLNGQLEAQEQFIRDLEALPQTADNEEQIRQAKRETSQITLDLIQTEIDAQQQLTQRVLDGIDEQLSRSQEAAKIRTDGLQLQAESLGSILSLEQARADLVSAQGTLAQEQIKTEIERAKKAGDTARAEELSKDLKREQVVQEKLAFEAKRQQLEIQAQQNALQAESALITAQIAETEAQIALDKARIEGASQKEIANLEKALSLRGQQVDAAQRGISQAAKANDLARKQLATEEQIARERRKQEAIRDGDRQTGNIRVRTIRTRTISNRVEGDDPFEATQKDRSGAGLADGINFPEIQKVQVVSLPPDPSAEPLEIDGEEFSPIVDTGQATVNLLSNISAEVQTIRRIVAQARVRPEAAQEVSPAQQLKERQALTTANINALLSGPAPLDTGAAMAGGLDLLGQSTPNIAALEQLPGFFGQLIGINSQIAANTAQDRAVNVGAINVSSVGEGTSAVRDLLEAEAFG